MCQPQGCRLALVGGVCGDCSAGLLREQGTGNSVGGKSASCTKDPHGARVENRGWHRARDSALEAHAGWYTRRFGECRPEWFVFAFGTPLPKDPTGPITSFKTAWSKVRQKAGVKGWWQR
jgi:hypothetical protein